MKDLTESEFKRLEDHLEQFTPRESAILALLMYCGIRVGELIRLIFKDLEDLDTTSPTLHVRAAISKTGYGRYIPLPPKARKWLHAYTFLASPYHRPLAPPDPLFPGTAARPHLSVHGAEQLVNRCCRRALNKHVTPHMLRHTYATRVLKFSNTREVQMLLGHKKLSSTEVYTHPTNEDLSHSVDKAFR